MKAYTDKYPLLCKKLVDKGIYLFFSLRPVLWKGQFQDLTQKYGMVKSHVWKYLHIRRSEGGLWPHSKQRLRY